MDLYVSGRVVLLLFCAFVILYAGVLTLCEPRRPRS